MRRFSLILSAMALVLLVVGSTGVPHTTYARTAPISATDASIAKSGEECPAPPSSQLFLPLTMTTLASRPADSPVTAQAVLTDTTEPPASEGVITISGIEPLEFNPEEAHVTFTLDCATFAEDTSAFAISVNDELYPVDSMYVTSNTVSVDIAFEDGPNKIVLLAEDSEGFAVTTSGPFWMGEYSLTVTVKDPSGAIVEGADVTLELGDDKRINSTATTDALGQVTFDQVPGRTVFLTAQGQNNLFGMSSVIGFVEETTLTLLGFNPPSPIDNNDFRLGTEGWEIGDAPVELIPHVEEGHSIGGDMDLQLSTSGEGPQSISRTFTVEEGTKAIRVRYRFITSEVPGGYYGTNFNDSFNVTIRGLAPSGGVWESNSMNGLGLGAFDDNGATDWREEIFPVTGGETVQIDISVANVSDDQLDSIVVVDLVKETKLEIQADKEVACPNQTVTFTPKTTPEGEITWVGDGTPATGTGNSFITRFTTDGEHTMNASAGEDSATTKVKINRLSGAEWYEEFPQSTDTVDLTPAFESSANDFISALQAAGANVRISTTYRPAERSYLMHYAFRIAHGLNPNNVPSMAGVDICWTHYKTDGTLDLAASRAAAQAMVTAYEIVYAPALNTRHTVRRAIDMTITWTGTLNIVDGSGAVIPIASTPRNGAGNTDLHAVGASYGAIKLVGDPPTGRVTGTNQMTNRKLQKNDYGMK